MDNFTIEEPKCSVEELKDRVRNALKMAFDFGPIDGGHHKAWVIDQIVRELTGDQYNEIIRQFCDGEDGPNTYEWDEGIAP